MSTMGGDARELQLSIDQSQNHVSGLGTWVRAVSYRLIGTMSHDKLTEEATDRTQPMVRSIPILGHYIFIAAALALNACQGIFKRYQTRQRHNDWASSRRRLHFWLFVVLATLSLGATWYYMFAFFAHSFRSWERTEKALSLHTKDFDLVSRVEFWLQNAGLFREAWETVIETPVRFWWSGQIFLWTTGWSVFLGVMGMNFLGNKTTSTELG